MSDSIANQAPESRLRRWRRSFYAGLEGMETSGYEHLADRIDALEARVQRLEANRVGPSSPPDSPIPPSTTGAHRRE